MQETCFCYRKEKDSLLNAWLLPPNCLLCDIVWNRNDSLTHAKIHTHTLWESSWTASRAGSCFHTICTFIHLYKRIRCIIKPSSPLDYCVFDWILSEWCGNTCWPQPQITLMTIIAVFQEQLILVGATTSSLLDGCGWVSELKEGESPALAALLDVVGEEQVRPLTVENSQWVRQCYRQY